MISSKTKKKTRVLILDTFIQNSTGSGRYSNKQGKEIKVIYTRKEKIKLSLFTDDMILNTENSQDVTKKLPKSVNEFSKGAGCTINILKSVAFLHTKNEPLQK